MFNQRFIHASLVEYGKPASLLLAMALHILLMVEQTQTN
jgi:hypothetical protein